MRKLWRLYHDTANQFNVSDEPATDQEKKVLHKTIKKVGEDIERFSFNTAVSAFMVCVNELGDLKCNKREVLEPLAVMVSSFAPHIGEELWWLLGNTESVALAGFPEFRAEYVVEDTVLYPVSFNGKTRFKLEMPAGSPKEEVEAAALAAPEAQKWLEGKVPKKVIVVPNKIVNVVI
jgi:leucyl-tRNA synthetase